MDLIKLGFTEPENNIIRQFTANGANSGLINITNYILNLRKNPVVYSISNKRGDTEKFLKVVSKLEKDYRRSKLFIFSNGQFAAQYDRWSYRGEVGNFVFLDKSDKISDSNEYFLKLDYIFSSPEIKEARLSNWYFGIIKKAGYQDVEGILKDDIKKSILGPICKELQEEEDVLLRILEGQKFNCFDKTITELYKDKEKLNELSGWRRNSYEFEDTINQAIQKLVDGYGEEFQKLEEREALALPKMNLTLRELIIQHLIEEKVIGKDKD